MKNRSKQRSISLYFIRSIPMWGSKCRKWKQKHWLWHCFCWSDLLFS